MGMLVDEGTSTRTGPQIASAIENVGGSLSMHSSGGTVKVLADDADLGLGLLFDCLMNPVFGNEELASKRDQLLSQLAEEDKLPEERAQRAFRAGVYGDHPYGRPTADTAAVKKLTGDDLKRFHRRLFVPGNTVVAIVGDFDSAKVVKSVRDLTSKWKGDPPPAPDVKRPPVAEKFTQTIISEPSAAQLTMYLGHLGIKRDNPDYYKLLVMDHVLGTGSGFTDRLSATLRDRQGLAYSVTARITGSAGDEPGMFTAYIGTFPDKFADVKAGFLKEIKRIRDEAPGRDEVEDVKQYLTGVIAFSLTTCEEAADMLQMVERFRLGRDYLADYRKAVERVSPEDVQAVARKYLDPERLTLVAAGPIDAAGKPLPGPKKE
jgi:zinc protease